MVDDNKKASRGDIKLADEQRKDYDGPREVDAPNDGGSGPAPYDVAAPGTPDNKVIQKGQREAPGPSESDAAEPRESSASS